MDDFIIRTKRDIPSVEIISSERAIITLQQDIPRPLMVEIIRAQVESLKERMGKGLKNIRYEIFKKEIGSEIRSLRRRKIMQVINGTGILVHTNLGRAPLSDNLVEKFMSHLTGYNNLEYDISSGKRGKRGDVAEKYLAFLSRAEAGTIVNNNAAAIFLILNTLANKKKVIISRGELVQIGGGFRIPDIITKSGARLIEIGTTNITTLDDYKASLEHNPALILKIHRSNFDISGFTEEIGIKTLVELGKSHNIPVINDLGSGVFIDTAEFAPITEPTVQSSVSAGAALTCFSGDKLLGGVQAGLIVGEREMIEKLKKNPIYRALRVDKIVFSAMEELLGYYLNGSWKENIKLWQLAGVKEAELYEKGKALLKKIGAGDRIILEGSQGGMGGGSLPELPLPSVAFVFRSALSPQKIAALFRMAEPPVIGRVTKESFIIDLKAIDDNDAKLLVSIIKNLIPQL